MSKRAGKKRAPEIEREQERYRKEMEMYDED